jgi:hypothetical protein
MSGGEGEGTPANPNIFGDWTFLSDFTTIRDQIRIMIGDINENDPLISDQAIEFFYTLAGSDLLGGALQAARAAAAKLALEFDKDLEGIRTNRSQRHRAMLDTIAQLEAQQAQGNFTFTVPEMGTVADADADNYPLTFEPSDITRPDWGEGV